MAVVVRRARPDNDPAPARHRAPAKHARPSKPSGPPEARPSEARPSEARPPEARPPKVGAAAAASAREAARPLASAQPTVPELVLPHPPTDKEKYAYVRRHAWVLTVCTILTFPPLVYSQIRMFEDSHWFLLYAPFMAFGTFCFLLSLVVDGTSRSFDLAAHNKIVADWHPLWYPAVDVFMPTCGEPLEILRNSWTHVDALRTAYRGALTPYVLDDAARPEVKAMAREFGFAYASRPNRGWYLKSGNLRYGYRISSGEYVLLLDADFAPRADLLDETLPYMDRYPDAGIVQTPQFFHVEDNQTWIERGAGSIQELFYRSIQTARANKGGAICVGSCAIYRRTALKQNDGMALAHHSEDLHTGFDLYLRGWRLIYLPIALSTGNCPDSLVAFVNQQYRWCSGTMSLLGNSKFWRRKIPLYTRLCYLSGCVGYIYTAVFTFIAPLLAIGILVLGPNYLLLKNMIFIAPVLFYAGVIYPMWHRSPYRLEAWAVRVLSGWAHAFAFWDQARGRLKGWQASGSGAKRQDGRRRLWIGLIGWSFGTSAFWAMLALWRMMTMDAYNFYLIFVLGVFQLIVVGRILIQPRAAEKL
jgi:cellulose synthase/poly-beta-1,6-N-acetylglucosamine synthase-like glycosyltransferase